MGKMLFGSSPSSQMMQTPGSRQSDQWFQGRANQKGMGFDPNKEFYDEQLDENLRLGDELERNSFADLGFGGGKQGVLASSMFGRQRSTRLASQRDRNEAKQQWEGRIMGGMGRGGGQVANTPGSPGLIGTLASGLKTTVGMGKIG